MFGLVCADRPLIPDLEVLDRSELFDILAMSFFCVYELCTSQIDDYHCPV